MITNEIRKFVFERANGRCENSVCSKLLKFESKEWNCHHVYWRSQYKGIDRDEAWCLSCLCVDCHTAKSGQAVHNGNIALDQYLKAWADRRKPEKKRAGGVHSDLIQKRISRKKAYKTKIIRYKELHNGLSPFQVEYRKQKEFRKKLYKNA